jgi:cytochrome c peroxidase
MKIQISSMTFGILGFAVTALTGAASAAELPAPISDADYHYSGAPDAARVELGRMLFFDKIMSGNKNISCATCHHPYLAGGDGLSLGVGEKGQFIGPMRTTSSSMGKIKQRVARNAPSLFNLGAKQFTQINWQGRHQIDASGRLSLPSGQFTPTGLDNVLAGQALFPLLNQTEMLGQKNENEVISAPPRGTTGPAQFPPSWDAYMQRLRGIPAYVTLFQTAFPEITSASNINISHYANAISAFETVAYRADNSPFDRYLRGETDALSPAQQRGMDLFYGSANCSSCHSGAFQTDHKFHAIAMPQIGPGVKSGLTQTFEDAGRAEVTLKTADKFKFRTSPLRNVAFTAPYGHSGTYATLEGVIRHHLDPVAAFDAWDRGQVFMPVEPDVASTDFAVMDDSVKRQSIRAANELLPSTLTDAEIKDIIEFLHALTDTASLDQRYLIPSSVPSGLPVGD